MIRFKALPGNGLQIIDELGHWSFSFDTDDIVNPVPCETSGFPFPIDNAATIEAESLSYSSDYGIHVRDSDGEMVSRVFNETKTFPKDTYYVDIDTRCKSYIRIHDAELEITAEDGRLDDPSTVTLDSPSQIDVGIRSRHTQPEATITTTEDPRDMMRAISYLGSSLKEFSCERSWPSLRGHPPTIELGESFRAPPSLEKPDTGITIEIPADYESVYAVAPLAFYLGADVVEGDSPRLRTDSGFTYDFDGGSLGDSAHQVTYHCFMLDCVVRNGGYFDYPMYERDAIKDEAIDALPDGLYDSPISEQVEHYLSIPFDALSDALPDTRTTTTLRDSPEDIEALPFLARDLHRVNVKDNSDTNTSDSTTESIARIRDRISRFIQNIRSQNHATPDRETDQNFSELDSQLDIVKSQLNESEFTTATENIPMGTMQVVPEAYENRLSRDGVTEDEFGIAVVGNDKEMLDEVEQVGETYEAQEQMEWEYSIDVYTELTTGELADVLMSDYQFLHYIGHMDDTGFVCSDGSLDATTLPYVSVEGFLLNACDSHEQGVELVRKGSLGGVVTLRDVVPDTALQMGARLSSLLNLGYPLGPSVQMSMGADPVRTGQYRVVGDAEISLRRLESGSVIGCHMVEKTEDGFVLAMKTFTGTRSRVGGTARAYADVISEECFIMGSIADSRVASPEEIVEDLGKENAPAFLPDGSFSWSSKLTSDKIREAAERVDD